MHILELKSHAAMSNENVLIQGIEIEINKIFTLCYSGIKLLKSVADLRNTIFERTRGQNFSLFFMQSSDKFGINLVEQECIPVGCLPPAAVTVCRMGGLDSPPA